MNKEERLDTQEKQVRQVLRDRRRKIMGQGDVIEVEVFSSIEGRNVGSQQGQAGTQGYIAISLLDDPANLHAVFFGI